MTLPTCCTVLDAELAGAPGGTGCLLFVDEGSAGVADDTEEGGRDHPGPVVECAVAVSLAVTSRECEGADWSEGFA